MTDHILNIDDLEYMDWGQGKNFSARFGLISPKIGAKKLGYNLTVVPAGKTAFPFHNHRVNEEMFFVVSGFGALRMGTETFAIKEGDVIACPAGDRGSAHQIINDSQQELKYLAVSTTLSPEVAEYPDSNKIGVITKLGDSEGGLPEMWRLMMKDEATQVDYWDGEDTA